MKRLLKRPTPKSPQENNLWNAVPKKERIANWLKLAQLGEHVAEGQRLAEIQVDSTVAVAQDTLGLEHLAKILR